MLLTLLSKPGKGPGLLLYYRLWLTAIPPWLEDYAKLLKEYEDKIHPFSAKIIADVQTQNNLQPVSVYYVTSVCWQEIEKSLPRYCKSEVLHECTYYHQAHSG